MRGRLKSITGIIGLDLVGQAHADSLSDATAETAGSAFSVLAENRGKAPARFILHVFSKEPERGRGAVIAAGYDFTTDPGFMLTIRANDATDPGRGIKMDLDLGVELPSNEKGPLVWFRCPEEIRGVFFLHYLVFAGKNMLARPGIL